MSEFEEYASFLDEEFPNEQMLQEQEQLEREEENYRNCDAEPWYDEDHNDPRQDIEKEVEL